LLHEMVDQWQAETGRRTDHGRALKHKAAREAGVLLLAAQRTIGGQADRRRTQGGSGRNQ
jgi:hypothetical protein